MKKTILVSSVILLAVAALSVAATTTAEQAEKAVKGWLKADAQPLGALLGQQIMQVDIFLGADEQPIYYVVYLDPSGFVIVPADDMVEPIIAFVSAGTYEPSPDNPLGALVSQDLHRRVEAARELQQPRSIALHKTTSFAQTKWRQLESLAEAPKTGPVIMGIGSISDVRVDPLVQSQWDQGDVCGSYCYNYYTPNHYICGCVATAMAQVMRFYEHPVDGIGVHPFTIYVDGYPDNPQEVYTRGGDGSGGPYNWSQMMLIPDCSITTEQREAIGSLCYDAGVAVSMQYSSSASGAFSSDAKWALTETFGYSNSEISRAVTDENFAAELNNRLNSTLDANLPTILGVAGDNNHMIIADGYGYNSSTLYHHLNMGWGGSYDAWYNLPNIDAGYTYNAVTSIIYNVFTSGTGQIISGRVTNSTGNPISGVAVTTEKNPTHELFYTTTNDRGIYAFTHLPKWGGTFFTVWIDRPGFFDQVIVTPTGYGNVWGADFTESAPTPPVVEPGNYSARPDAPLIITLQAVDEGYPDPPAKISYVIASLPEHGMLNDPQAGAINSTPYTLTNFGDIVTYTSETSYIGTDSFTFKANDGGTPPEGGDSSVATINMDVSGILTIGSDTLEEGYALGGGFDRSRYQVIYLASELGTKTGIITALALDITAIPDHALPYYTIRMKHTDLSLYTDTDRVFDPSGWTVVYRNSAEVISNTGWKTFTFSRPFVYNGTDNIFIDFSQCGPTGTGTVSGGGSRCSRPGNMRSLGAGAHAWERGDPLYWGESGEKGFMSENVPNVQLTIAPTEKADINLDMGVDFIDFAILANQWMQSPGTPSADIAPVPNGDNLVNELDLKELSENWLEGVAIKFYDFSLDIDPNWTTEGEWAFGQPAGIGGDVYGNPDPSSGFTGTNVYGVNLNGDYDDTTPGGPHHLTAGPFNCSSYHYVRLRFVRWLNDIRSPYTKHKIECSNDGVSWNFVWEHTQENEIWDADWQPMEYWLVSTADNQETVYIRWSYEIGNPSYPASGWNIDDIELLGDPE